MGCCHAGSLHESRSLDSLATVLKGQSKAQRLSSTLPPSSRKYGPPTVPLLHDIWFEVLLFLRRSSVAKVFRVCSVLRDFCEEPALWRALLLRDRTKIREPYTYKIVTHSFSSTMDYYWLYRVQWCVQNWGIPAKSVVFEPWPEFSETETLKHSGIFNSDVTRVTMGHCCHPHLCLIFTTQEKLNVHITFKKDQEETYHDVYLNLALRSASCPLREPLCIDPKDPYAKGLSDEVLELCRTHAILPRDFCRLRDALQREVQLVRDCAAVVTGHPFVGPVEMSEVGVRYHGRTLGLRLDFVQVAHLWRAYVKLGMIHHDKPIYPFLLTPNILPGSDKLQVEDLE